LRLPSGSLREIARNKNRGLFTSKITEFNHKVGALHFINAPYKIRRSHETSLKNIVEPRIPT
ncbi:MAG: hypothetical protein ACKPJO_28085, partial [Dolichospermum sp.]